MIPKADLAATAATLLDEILVMDDCDEGLEVLRRALVAVARASAERTIAHVETAGLGGLALDLRGRLLAALGDPGAG